MSSNLLNLFLNDTKSAKKCNIMPSKRLPLEHIDKINSSIKTLNKIQVTIKNSSKSFDLFKLSGDFPAYISSINTGNFNY
jgi:hypothetical protein